MRDSTMRKALMVGVVGFGAMALVGCGEKPLASEDLEDRYAMAFMDGFWVGYKFVKAEEFDPATGDLIDVRVEDGTRIIHADRAEILIDEAAQTVSLRLIGIVGADPETGSLIEIEEFTTEPGKIKVSAGD